MKRKLALVEVLLKMRAKSMCLWLAAVALVNILGAIFLTKIGNINKMFSAMEAMLMVSGFALFINLLLWCWNAKNSEKKRFLLFRRIGLNEKDRYMAVFIANFITYAVTYVVFTLIAAASYCILTALRFGTESMVQVMVMHNKSFLFGEILPLYQPVLVIRNIILMICFTHFSAYAALILQTLKVPFMSALSMGVCHGFILLGFITRKGIYVGDDYNDAFKWLNAFIFGALLIATVVSVVNTVKWCKKDGYREGELI